MFSIFVGAYLLQATYIDLYNDGRKLMDQGKPREAGLALENSVALNPGYVPALRDLAEAYVKLKLFPQAIEQYQKIIRMNPRDISARARLAELFSWVGDYDKAIVTYRDSLELDPLNNGLKTGLAQTLRWSHRYDEAERLYKDVLQSDPENRDALKGLAKTYSMTGDLVNAVQTLEKAIKLYPMDSELYKDKGTVLAWQKDFRNAVEYLNKAVALSPNYTEAFRTLGDVYTWARSYKPAIDAYKKTSEIEPGNIENHVLLARAYRASGDRRMAEEAVKAALKIDPSDATALELLRDIRSEPKHPIVKDVGEAIELLSFMFGAAAILAIGRSKKRMLRRKHIAYFYLINFIMPALVIISFASYMGKDSFMERLNIGFIKELTEAVLLVALSISSVALLWTEQRSKEFAKTVILAIGAHPDDIELGCGGFIMRAKDSGAKVYGLTMSKGEKGTGKNGNREAELKRAAGFMELDNFWVKDFPDTELNNSIPYMKDVIEEKIKETGANMVLTHSAIDIHTDHQAVFEATKLAARNSSILCYEDVSTPREFVPNYFMNVTRFIEDKMKLISFHRTQGDKPYMDPEVVKGRAAHRGIQSGVQYAEAFRIYKLLR